VQLREAIVRHLAFPKPSIIALGQRTIYMQ